MLSIDVQPARITTWSFWKVDSGCESYQTIVRKKINTLPMLELSLNEAHLHRMFMIGRILKWRIILAFDLVNKFALN